jgi:hypothetical protein
LSLPDVFTDLPKSFSAKALAWMTPASLSSTTIAMGDASMTVFNAASISSCFESANVIVRVPLDMPDGFLILILSRTIPPASRRTFTSYIKKGFGGSYPGTCLASASGNA